MELAGLLPELAVNIDTFFKSSVLLCVLRVVTDSDSTILLPLVPSMNRVLSTCVNALGAPDVPFNAMDTCFWNC